MDHAPEEKKGLNFDSAGLQFDKAEISTIECSTCSSAINDPFFRIEQKEICKNCRDRVAELMTGGSGMNRFAKAAIYGSVAAVAGGLIYWAILHFTGYQVGLISILVGFMVGAAVKAGSDQRGGWVYQLLAVFLTYTAIVSAYVPLFAMEWQRLNALRTETKAAENAQPKPATAIATPAATPAPLAEGAAIDENVADEEPLSFGGFVVAMVMLVGFIYIIPFYDSLIGLAIIAFGLYKAWELNKRMQSTITGPFPVPVPHAPEEATASA